MKPKNLFFIVVFLALLSNGAIAQQKEYQFTIAGGAGASLFFNHIKQPAFSGKIWGEKQFSSDETRYFLLALEYSTVSAAKSKTELLSNPGTTTVTYTYYPSSLLTLTFGGRKYLENKIIYGLGMGLGISHQGVTFTTYSDPILNYEQDNKIRWNWGLGSSAQIGYKPGNWQIIVSYHGVYNIFHTVDLNDRADREQSSFVAVFGLSVGYTF